MLKRFVAVLLDTDTADTFNKVYGLNLQLVMRLEQSMESWAKKKAEESYMRMQKRLGFPNVRVDFAHMALNRDPLLKNQVSDISILGPDGKPVRIDTVAKALQNPGAEAGRNRYLETLPRVSLR